MTSRPGSRCIRRRRRSRLIRDWSLKRILMLLLGCGVCCCTTWQVHAACIARRSIAPVHNCNSLRTTCDRAQWHLSTTYWKLQCTGDERLNLVTKDANCMLWLCARRSSTSPVTKAVMDPSGAASRHHTWWRTRAFVHLWQAIGTFHTGRDRSVS